MTLRPSSPSELRLHRQRKERQAFDDYAEALRKWERAREQAENVAWEVQLTSAELNHKMLEGRPNEELEALRQAMRELQDSYHQHQTDARRAKQAASKRFAMLVAARNARLELEKCLDETSFSKDATITSLAPGKFTTLAEMQWN